MSDVKEAAPGADTRIAALVGYGLFIAAVANGFTAVAGVVLAYIKRADARGTIWESHFTNMIRVFWIALAIVVVIMAAALFGIVDLLAAFDSTPKEFIFLVPVLFALGIGSLVWYLYRTIRGFIRALDGEAY